MKPEVGAYGKMSGTFPFKNHRGGLAMRSKRASTGAPRHARPDALLWPRDLSGRCARATAIGSGRLLVENHTGILELTDTRVRLATGDGPITVTGRGLSLCEVRPGALIVKGAIQRVDLPCEGGGQP